MNYIENIIEPDTLYLTWQAPEGNDRTRFVVGVLLENEEGNICLRYLNDSDDFNRARKLGFAGYPAFRNLNVEHCHGVLDAFRRRLPPRTRGDFAKYLDKLRIKGGTELSDFALLGYSGAKLPTDGFSIIHPFDQIKGGCELLTEIAGFRYYNNKDPSEIVIGSMVKLLHEENNQYDKNAIAIMLNNEKIGYINRVLAKSASVWMDKGYSVDASIERVNGEYVRPLVYVFIKVRSK